MICFPNYVAFQTATTKHIALTFDCYVGNLKGYLNMIFYVVWILDKHQSTCYYVGTLHERLIRGVLPHWNDSLISGISH